MIAFARPVGQDGEPFRLAVEAGKIREMARATGASHPSHRRDERAVATPTYLMVAELWRGEEHDVLGREFMRSGIVHGTQEFIFHGPPPCAGDALVGASRIERVYEKEGRRGGTMTFVEAVTEYRDAEGRLVAETRGTLIRAERDVVAAGEHQ